MSNDENFKRELDKFVKKRIKELTLFNLNYFNQRIDVEELLRHLKDVMHSARREKIMCVLRNQGNERAVNELIDEMQKYANFAWNFLRGLNQSKLPDMAREILKGWESNPALSTHSSAIRELAGSPHPDTPPPYDADNNDIPHQLFQEQDKEFSRANINNHYVPSRSTSALSYPNSEYCVTSVRVPPTQEEYNRFPSGSTRDENIPGESALGSLCLSDGGAASKPPPYDTRRAQGSNETGADENSTTDGNDLLPCTYDQAFTLQRVSSAAQGNYNGSQGGERAISTGQGEFFPEDVHPSEVCVSEPSVREETVPKRVGTEVERPSASDGFMSGDSGRCDAILPCSTSTAPPQSSLNSSSQKIAEPSTMSTNFIRREQPSGKVMQPSGSGEKSVADEDGVPAAFVASDAVTVRQNESECTQPEDGARWSYVVAALAIVLLAQVLYRG